MIYQQIPEQVEQLAKRFVRRQQTLGVAESCTGGLISALIASYPGVSDFFAGSVVSYAGRVKRDMLNVPRSLIHTVGEVSAPVAVAMARGARQQLQVDWSVSVTGVAGPSGGTVEKPVGTVCFGVSGPGVEEGILHHFPTGERREIQWQSALYALTFLLDKVPNEPMF